MENELELKWRRIQQAMRQEEADGCLLTMNMNLYYVSCIKNSAQKLLFGSVFGIDFKPA